MNEQQTSNSLRSLVESVGGEHSFQKKMFAVIVVKWLLASMLQFSPNLLFLTQDFTCVNGQNGYEDCQQWVCKQGLQEWKKHLLTVPNSLSYEFDWYLCDRQWVVSVIQSMLYLGTFVGYVTVPYFADNFGRLRTEGLVWLIAATGALLLAFSWNIYVVGIALFLCGAGVNSSLTLHYCFINELVVGKTRGRMIVGLQITYSVGVCFIALLSKYVVEWRALAFYYLALPMILILFGNRFLQETPEFTINLGIEQLRLSMNRIATTNEKEQLTLEELKKVVTSYNRPTEQLSVISLFKYESIRLSACCCTCVHVALDFSYDGVLYSLNQVGFSLSTNQMVMAAAEILAAVICGFIIPRFRRKISIIVSLLFTGILLASIIGIGFIHFDLPITKACVELGVFAIMRFTMSSVWAFYSVYLTELFPGQITSLAICFFHSIGTLAASFSPYIKLIGKTWSLAVMTCLLFLAAGHVTCLVETKDKPHRQRIIERDQNQREQENMSIMMTQGKDGQPDYRGHPDEGST